MLGVRLIINSSAANELTAENPGKGGAQRN
jgi:hypothetical protein